MGVINWKEAAPADQEAELQLSVEQALRSAAPLTAPVPVWADGPDSGHLDDDVADDAAPGFAALIDGADVSFVAADEADDAPAADPDADAELADWLALARETAERAVAADSSRGARAQAVAKAWDFALAAEQQPSLCALLDDAGLKRSRGRRWRRWSSWSSARSATRRGLPNMPAWAMPATRASDRRTAAISIAIRAGWGWSRMRARAASPMARRRIAARKTCRAHSAHAIILEHDAGDAVWWLIARTMPGGHIGIVAKAAGIRRWSALGARRFRLPAAERRPRNSQTRY